MELRSSAEETLFGIVCDDLTNGEEDLGLM